MTWCPKCGISMRKGESDCPCTLDSVDSPRSNEQPTEQLSDWEKIWHVVPMSVTAWLCGQAVVGFFYATLSDRQFELDFALVTLLLCSCTALLLARADRADLRPVHIVLGSIIPSLIVWTLICIFDPPDLGSYPDSIAELSWTFVVVPAAGIIGMIRGVRARRGSRPFAALFWCAALVSICCCSAWWLSFTSFPRVFLPGFGRQAIRYIPPQTGFEKAAEPAGSSVRHRKSSN